MNRTGIIAWGRSGVVIPSVVYAVSVAVLWLIPPARSLHVEASAAVSTIAFFTTGLLVIRAVERRQAVTACVLHSLAALVVPFGLLAGATAIRPACWTWTGPMLFVAFVAPATIFGASLAYLVSVVLQQWRRTAFVMLGLLVSIASLAFDLKLHPQFYSYSHVFGGFLGPVYDAELALRPGVYSFRLVTLSWSILFALLGTARLRGLSRRLLVALIANGLALVGLYGFRVEMGFNTSADSIRRQLHATVQTEHFDIWYDPRTPRVEPLEVVAARQEFEYDRIARAIGLAPAEKVQVYLYASPRQRADATGARWTSVAPVWLGSPQIHLLERQHEDSFSHELVHVFSREFSLPVVRASPLIGLVEGLAVALEPPSLWLDPDARVSAAARVNAWDAEELSARLRELMTPLGFWTGRGVAAYSMNGSFVAYLLRTQRPDRFREVYRTARFAEAFDMPLDDLAMDWAAELLADTTHIGPAVSEQVRLAFSTASLFESRCPHVVPELAKLLADGDEAWFQRDTLRAADLWNRANELESAPPSIRDRQALLAMYEGEYERADSLTLLPDSVRSFLGSVIRGDALAALGEAERARRSYDTAMGLVRGVLIQESATVELRRSLAAWPSAIRSFYRSDAGMVVDGRLGRAGQPVGSGGSTDEDVDLWGDAARASRRGEYAAAVEAFGRVAVPVLVVGSGERDIATDDVATISLIEWYRHAGVARAAASMGDWGRSAEAWTKAAFHANAAEYPFASVFARYRAGEAEWIRDSVLRLR